jgi:23S rRNA pseudouridine2605 synthase
MIAALRRGERPIDTQERLQRVLAARGIASRRKAEDLIREGRVQVNGETVTQLGVKVDPRSADIRVDGKRLRGQKMRYLMLFKPTGYITTTSDEKGRDTVMELVKTPERVYPVGRLDRDTEGLLLLTNDGELANRVMHPRYRLEKEYTILTPQRPSDAAIQRVRDGVVLDGKRVVPDEFRIFRETRDGVVLTITVHEGLNRVVRRLMEAVDIPITRLRRVRVGPIDIGSMAPGMSRELTPGELGSLQQALKLGPEDAASLDSPAPPRIGAPRRAVEKPHAPGGAPRRGGVRSSGPGGASPGGGGSRPPGRSTGRGPKPGSGRPSRER